MNKLKTTEERLANAPSDHFYFIEKMITTLYQLRTEFKGGRVPKYLEALIKYRNTESVKKFEKDNKKEIKELK
jgi:hypothetical protein